MLPWRFPQLPVSRIALAVIQGPMFDRSIRTTKASGSSIEFEIRGNWSRLFPSPVVASRLLTKVGGKEDAVWGSFFFSVANQPSAALSECGWRSCPTSRKRAWRAYQNLPQRANLCEADFAVAATPNLFHAGNLENEVCCTSRLSAWSSIMGRLGESTSYGKLQHGRSGGQSRSCWSATTESRQADGSLFVTSYR